MLSYRRADGVTVVSIEPPLTESELSGEGEGGTQAIAAHVESWVRRYPDQWLWMHRRFKNISPRPVDPA